MSMNETKLYLIEMHISAADVAKAAIQTINFETFHNIFMPMMVS